MAASAAHQLTFPLTEHELDTLSRKSQLPVQTLKQIAFQPQEELQRLRVADLKVLSQALRGLPRLTHRALYSPLAQRKSDLIDQTIAILKDLQRTLPFGPQQPSNGLASNMQQPYGYVGQSNAHPSIAHPQHQQQQYAGGYYNQPQHAGGRPGYPSAAAAAPAPAAPRPAVSTSSANGSSAGTSSNSYRSPGVPSEADIKLIETMLSHPAFRADRNPQHRMECVLESGLLRSASRTVVLRYRLTPEQLADIRNNTKAVHLRLFSQTSGHQEWPAQSNVRFNGVLVRIPEQKIQPKYVSKAYRLAKPLEISGLQVEVNTITAALNESVWISSALLCVVELVSIRKIESLVEEVHNFPLNRIIKRQEGRLELPAAAPPTLRNRSCRVCAHPRQEDLMRCSRCRKAWYCGQDHQRSHWPKHKVECRPYTKEEEEQEEEYTALQEHLVNKERVAAEAKADIDDGEEVQELASILSLRCPLSISRMDVAAKGRKCNHQSCFDLETFLLFCCGSGVWQCPTCHEALPVGELVIDPLMNRILKETEAEEAETVDFNPDGTYRITSTCRDDEDADDDEPPAKRAKTEGSSNASSSVSSLDSDMGSQRGAGLSKGLGLLEDSPPQAGNAGTAAGASIADAIVID